MPAQSRPSGPSMTARVTRLEELVKQGVDFDIAKTLVGLSDDDVRKALGIPAGTKLTNRVIMIHLVQQVGKNRSGVETANRRLSAAEKKLGDIQRLLGDKFDAALLQKGQTHGRKSFIQALRDRKVSDEKIRKVLVIVDDGKELDYTDENLFGDLFDALSVLQDKVETHDEQIHVLTTKSEDHDEQLNRLTVKVAKATSVSGSFPWVGLILAVLLGFVTTGIWLMTESLHNRAMSPVVQSWLMGLVVFLIVMAFAFALTHGKSKVTTTSNTRSASKKRSASTSTTRSALSSARQTYREGRDRKRAMKEAEREQVRANTRRLMDGAQSNPSPESSRATADASA